MEMVWDFFDVVFDSNVSYVCDFFKLMLKFGIVLFIFDC